MVNEVRGGEDPLTNTLTITGDEYQTDQEFIGTTSPSAKLRAVVTEVSEM